MYKVRLLLVAICFSVAAHAQLPFDLTLTEISISNVYGVQSYASGYYNGKWYIFGGRTDGLHQRQPFAAFAQNDNHTNILILDFENKSFETVSISPLATPMKEQLQSTNISYQQVGNNLYLLGGYGYSNTKAAHITHDLLTKVDLATLATEIDQSGDITLAFDYLQDSTMAVTGGYLHHLNDTFYLVGGQEFQGQYNPMGPTQGPGFYQQYTEEIRKFQVTTTPNFNLTNYHAINDPQNLHRRDYNVCPTIFPNGTRGFTAFTGVFQHTVDLPWENGVDITPTGYQVRNDLSQKLSHYHGANLGIHNGTANEMYTLFFGGIAKYYYDNGTLTEDPNVPFVKTISAITRDANDVFTEVALPIEMPGYLGSGAEFFPVNKPFFDEQHILQLEDLPKEKTLVGYIFGGIESSASNIFFSNTGTQSGATARAFEVYLDPTAALSVKKVPKTKGYLLDVGLEIEEQVMLVNVSALQHESVTISLYNMGGKLLYQSEPLKKAQLPHRIPLSQIQPKLVIVKVIGEGINLSTKIQIR